MTETESDTAGMLPDLHYRGLAVEAQGQAAQRGSGLQRRQVLLLSAVREAVREDQQADPAHEDPQVCQSVSGSETD